MAAPRLLDSETTVPPVGAALLMVTVPEALAVPPTRLEGLTETLLMMSGLTVSVAVFVAFSVPVIVTTETAETVLDVIGKVAVV